MTSEFTIPLWKTSYLWNSQFFLLLRKTKIHNFFFFYERLWNAQKFTFVEDFVPVKSTKLKYPLNIHLYSSTAEAFTFSIQAFKQTTDMYGNACKLYSAECYAKMHPTNIIVNITTLFPCSLYNPQICVGSLKCCHGQGYSCPERDNENPWSKQNRHYTLQVCFQNFPCYFLNRKAHEGRSVKLMKLRHEILNPRLEQSLAQVIQSNHYQCLQHQCLKHQHQ